jgi:large subunit ribosomal protein L25
MERVKLAVRPRAEVGSKQARKLRASDEVPGVIYSRDAEARPIVVGVRDLRHAVAGNGGLHAILDVTVQGTRGAKPAVIKDLQVDPVRDRVIHIDLHEIRLDEPITTTVPVQLAGEAPGVTMGGSISQPVHEVNVTGLPADIPDHIAADISALDVGGTLRLADVTPPEGITFADDLDNTVLATITAPITDADLVTEAEAEAAAEAAEAEAELEPEEAEAEPAGEGE